MEKSGSIKKRKRENVKTRKRDREKSLPVNEKKE
jgi:hypothetical protein